ncbi:MAG TPA: carboxypeptidase regulatory-like domain-containing protein, partial [Vicinamibacteria bacterium]
MVACLAWVGAPGAAAQDSRGSITGKVADASGGAVPGASVQAVNDDTNLTVTAVSDVVGSYTLLYLPAGRYTVSAELNGFRKAVRTGVEVRVGDKLTLELKLDPGGVTETVEVSGATPLLDAASGSAGQVIDSKRIQLLPLSDGNPFVLSRLAAGAAYTGDLKFSRPFDNSGTSSITADGASGGNEFTLDGSPNMAHSAGDGTRRVAYVPPSDAVEEFKVETATYDAQQGHTAGATVNVVMKSGTNKLRGTLYEFYRDDKISANDFFLNRANKARPPMSYNRFGGSLGGPLVLPGYHGRDRSFFFVAYEGLHDEFPEPDQFSVPTAKMRNGDFSELLSQGIVIYNPFSGVRNADGRIVRQPFPGNVIPASLLNPVARNYLNLFPLPNQAGDAQGRNNFLSPQPRTDRFNSVSARLDHRLSDAHRFFVRYSWNDRKESRNNWTGEVDGVRPTGNFLFRVNHALTYDHLYTHSPTTLVNVRLGFSRFEEPNVRQHEGAFDLGSLGFASSSLSQFGDASYVPRFEIGVRSPGAPNSANDAISTLGDTIGDAQFNNVYSVQPTLTRIKGNHAVRLGYDFRVYRYNRRAPGHAAGRYDFGTDYTRGPLDTSSGAAVGQQFASFLLGLPSGGFIERNASLANQSLYHGAFVQDDWKVNSKLTVNLGLRYDYETPVTERFNRGVRNFDPALASPIAGAAEAAYARNPLAQLPASAFHVRGGLTFMEDGARSMWGADKNNIQPRLGFAYQADSRTVVRGGWAIYTVANLAEAFNQSGFSQTTNIVSSPDGGLTFRPSPLTDPFPTVIEPLGAGGGAGTFMGRDLGGAAGDRFQRVFTEGTRDSEQHMRWSIGFQRELPGQWVFEAAYVGNHGYDLTLQTADGTNLRNYVDLNALPEQYLSRSPVRDDPNNSFLTGTVPNPFAGLVPGTTHNNATIQRQNLLRPYPQFLAVRTERHGGTSNYNSAQFRLEKRFTAGYSLLLGYTWSRFTEKVVLLNLTDAEPTQYLADADTPHRVTASVIWQVPVGKGRRFDLGSLGNAILGGWSWQGIYNWQSGRPIAFGNIYYNGDP